MFQHTAPQKWCQTLLDDVPKDDDERGKMREAAKVEAISVEQSEENFRLVQNLSDEFSLMGKRRKLSSKLESFKHPRH